MTTLATIFQQYSPSYLAQYADRLLPSHRRAIAAIRRCRTSELGGHIYQCDACGEERYLYHSCRNRHCPQCQHDAGQRWLEKQQRLRFGVPYFMLTFTLPAELRPVVRRHQKRLYNLLFRASAAATQQLARDPRFVGGQIGMVGVLHTWGRNLSYHPHVHYLVPGGGLAPDGKTWLPANPNFLVPVKPLAILFRAKFRQAVQESDLWSQIPEAVWQTGWVVHCQPVGDGAAALKYLAPYIFRVALSNNRIVRVTSSKVTFRYRQSDTGTPRLCTLPVLAFMHRFLQHVLPKGFVKVRYYGFFSAAYRQRLTTLLAQLPVTLPPETPPPAKGDSVAHPVRRCPRCNQPLRLLRVIPQPRYKPP